MPAYTTEQFFDSYLTGIGTRLTEDYFQERDNLRQTSGFGQDFKNLAFEWAEPRTVIPVAVYGTLRLGMINCEPFIGKDAHKKHLFTGFVQQYSIFTLGGHKSIPYAFPNEDMPNSSPAVVDVFMVDPHQLEDLDNLEGHPAHYVREQVTVLPEGRGESKQCYMYVAAGQQLSDKYVEVPNGDYAAFVRS